MSLSEIHDKLAWESSAALNMANTGIYPHCQIVLRILREMSNNLQDLYQSMRAGSLNSLSPLDGFPYFSHKQLL